MNYQVATLATNWWIVQMKYRCKKLFPSKVTGDDSNLVITDDSLKEELSRFQEILLREIISYIENGRYLCLTCSFIPDSHLSRLAKQAAISKSYFPVQIEMEIFRDSIKVAVNGQDLRELQFPTE